MLDLSKVPNGTECEVLWMFGSDARLLRDEYHVEESNVLQMISNHLGNVIVSAGGKRIAINEALAQRVKVQICA